METIRLLFLSMLLNKILLAQVIGGDPGIHFLRKGETKLIMDYAVIASDKNGDGVAQYYGYLLNSSVNKKCISSSPNFLEDARLDPPQSSKSFAVEPELIYVNTSNLKVGLMYWTRPMLCSEISFGGIGSRICIGSGLQTIYIIPYAIPITSVQNSTGSYSSFYFSWTDPSPLYWNLDSYSIFRRDDDSVRLGELQLCDKIRTDITSNIHSITINDSKRGINSFYAVVGYDSLGEAIAISESFQITYPKTTFSLTSPTDESVLNTLMPTLDWEDYSGATSYTLWYSE
ncbi:MAG: hypothetical protein HXY50_16275, partial [Ignavibacteriaceae bacterium]|nr:hypothetical protein [Ignavibacteriaceae bacterium]